MKKQIVSLQIKRENGVVSLWVQGDPEVFRPLRGEGEFLFHGIKTYLCRKNVLAECVFNRDFLTAINSETNLQFLLACSLAEGVTIDLGEQVWSEDFIGALLQRFKEAIRKLYLEFLKPVNVRLNVYAEEIISI